MNEESSLSIESYKKILDSIVDIVHAMNLSADKIKEVSTGTDVRFARRAIGGALSSLMEAVWDIEDEAPELKGYYNTELSKRS